MDSIRTVMAVGMGGFLGANARYAVSTYLPRYIGRPGYYGTLFVNVTGSLLLAVFIGWALKHTQIPNDVKLIIGTGFFGAYTTYSTFANEAVALFNTGEATTAVWYIVLTQALALFGVVVGLWIANQLG